MILPPRAALRRGGILVGLLLGFLAAAPVFACDLATAPTSRWTVRQDHGTAWLVTPCGDRFYAVGVNVLDAGKSGVGLDRPHYDWHHFAPTLPDWIAATRHRLDEWGFNSAGAWSLPPQQLKLPTVINLELGRLARFHWFDPFDPAAAARVYSEAARLTAPYRNSPYRIGYFADNEVGWWGGALFLFFSQKPAGNFTKQHWVALLRRLYHEDWRHFTADFVPPSGVNSWDALLAAEAPTYLRPGGQGSRAIAAWTHEVAERYYTLTQAALKKADPEALFFGDRLPIYYDPAAVRAEAPHVDVIAVNYNVDSPEGWIAPYFFDGLRRLSGGKPVLISEWFYAARQNRSGNRDNGHLMTVETQAERGRGAAAAAANFARIGEILGIDWFQYYDYPQGGRADHEDYDFGLVDNDDRPYEKLVTALGQANHALPAIHAAAVAPRIGTRIIVPKASIDPAHSSLIDWPKPASLLPPLQGPRGGVAFGEVYLTWSDQGLAFATIGQDYYDLDLLAYDGPFPLSEAYHVEIDVDAGAGQRRLVLYFIPPGPGKGGSPMRVKLCAGPAVDNRCAEVPGAQALYFGADQPRVVAEALLPWSALGRDAAPASRRIKLAVSGQSWYRARWMSLSGRSPAEDSAEGADWRSVRLGEP
jgi:hypothetical protein